MVFNATFSNMSSSRRHVPLFVRGRFYTGTSQEKRKQDNSLISCSPMWCPFTK